jgi:hypothetical protein
MFRGHVEASSLAPEGCTGLRHVKSPPHPLELQLVKFQPGRQKSLLLSYLSTRFKNMRLVHLTLTFYNAASFLFFTNSYTSYN